MFRNVALCLVILPALQPAALDARDREMRGDPHTLAVLEDFNEELRAEWMDLRAEWMDMRAEQIEVLTVDQERTASQLHMSPFRWVPNDVRRSTPLSLTYRVDLSDGSTGKGHERLSAATTERAIDNAMATWAAAPCFEKAGFGKRPDDGGSFELLEAYLRGRNGRYRFPATDVVHAGWLKPEYFDRLTPDGGNTIIALSVTFIFVDQDGNPTDVDQDGYFDTAANEVYYNEGFSWSVVETGSMDVEAVALHEIGHSLGLGHGTAGAESVMSPVYAGPRREPTELDRAALCAIWGSWPQ